VKPHKNVILLGTARSRLCREDGRGAVRLAAKIVLVRNTLDPPAGEHRRQRFRSCHHLNDGGIAVEILHAGREAVHEFLFGCVATIVMPRCCAKCPMQPRRRLLQESHLMITRGKKHVLLKLTESY